MILWRSWVSSWRFPRRRGPEWWPETGSFIGTMPRSTPPPWCRSGCQLRPSGSLSAPLFAKPGSSILFLVFLFQTVKKQLVCKTLTQESFKSMWEGCLHDCHWRGHRHRFLVVVQAVLEVCSYQQWIRQEILTNIWLKNSNRFYKNKVLWKLRIHTTYIQ
jgi:hypothetical protein